MTDYKLTHLRMIQDRIRGCANHGLVMKVAALLLVLVLFVVHVVENGGSVSLKLFDVTGVLLLVVLWLTDAHLHGEMAAYVDLYDDVRKGGDTDMRMSVAQYRKQADLIRASWKAPVVYLYVGSICAVALLASMAPMVSATSVN